MNNSSNKGKLYRQYGNDFNLAEEERGITQFWQENKTFEKSVEQRPSRDQKGKNNEFIFYDGPPFANGLPHYGHLLTGFVKDIFARYQTIKGKRVERRFGWDCHGLPAEMEVEKELGVSGRIAISEYGIDKFNDTCKSSVMKYADKWQEYVNKSGRWVDFEHGYRTMDKSYMESVIWAFKELYKKGLLYEDYRVMPYSWKCETPLSNFETRIDNAYREKASKAVTVTFKLKDIPKNAPEGCLEYRMLVWTTTPWTLPSNLALAVGEDIDYRYVIKDGICYIIADALAAKYQKEIGINKEDNDRWIETERLYIKKIKPEDREEFKKIATNAEVSRRFASHYPDFDSNFDLLLEHQEKYGFSHGLVFEKESGKAIGRGGFLYLNHYPNKEIGENNNRDEIEVGYGFLPEYWGKGYATEIAIACANAVFNKAALNVDKVVGVAKADNEKSHKVLEKTGMSFERRTHYRDTSDCVLYSVTRVEFYKKFADYNFINHSLLVQGKDLVGLSYAPLFPYFADTENAFQVLAGDFVTTSDGTGVVHIAPGFGEDDQNLCKINNIQTICPVDDGGRFDSRVRDYQGMQVFEANDPIIIRLKEQGRWVKTEQYLHNYPHCWRTDTPLIYKAVPSWYVEVTKIKDRMVELNQQINWIPGHIKQGLFGKWLEGARDWSISRNRFWGCPVPVWKSDDPQYPRIDVYGSIAELEADFGVEVQDLHRPFIDSLVRPNPDDPTGKSMMRRVSDVLDCWFESGSMPYGQVHYPFEKEDWFKNHFPADFIVEYTAQTRGWFYTLMVLSTALFDSPPFLNCICHGVILDENSQKLSKRLKNYPDPLEMFDKYGSDPMRFFMASSTVMRGNELNIDKKGEIILESYRSSIKPILNSYNFFALYANADQVKAKYSIDSQNIMDRYILAKVKAAVVAIEKAMDEYNTPLACQVIEEFFEILNNWYIRRNRNRFWGSEKSDDKIAAYDSLYTILNIIVKAISPLLPFTAELIYRDLGDDGESVHLQDFPDISMINDEVELVADMDMVRDICGTALSIRTINNLRIRLPLNQIEIICNDTGKLADYLDLIKDEVNIKNIVLSSEIGDKAETILKLNFKTLGKKLGANMKMVAASAKNGEFEVLSDNKIRIADHILDEEDYELVMSAKGDNEAVSSLSKHDGVVIVDTYITESLEIEGIARDVVRLIQQSRKDANFDVSDKIKLSIQGGNDKILTSVKMYENYIKDQVLAVELIAGNNDNNANNATMENIFEHSLDGSNVIVAVSKI